ncbi:alpha/beta hydrolase [Alterisphingorhabdus coralli]|uniref:Alpha/beta hydrolase-fold protein n=1 Tax=Alterisphingorhabdus coralli TaxID=3071408 RepID=A0AA97F925_9SPHN|nr:alpha/beta hydrolase-fold protein [Parasphingorhabdus sp. SCSIO 66989]WOE75517.1 alpha/beta hydrolase-fold protein [Parasphingorhabdus sp. SCSIO 66989]
MPASPSFLSGRALALAFAWLIIMTLAPIAANAQDKPGAESEPMLVDISDIVVAGLPDQSLSIWLPRGYLTDSERRYPVLYMHDAQNLFDPAKSNFNKVWAADKAMIALVEQGTIEPHIIVGIWHPEADRYRQYAPQGPFERLPQAKQDSALPLMNNGPILSNSYLDYIVHRLKPRIDKNFRTLADRDNTAIAGSSMGGLISCYAFMRHPGVFGRAACISTHWPLIALPDGPPAPDADVLAMWPRYFAENLGSPDGRRLWLDHGTATLDAHYPRYQAAVDQQVIALGWQQGRDFESRVYEGAPHEENAWAERLPEILGWLLAGAGHDATKTQD